MVGTRRSRKPLNRPAPGGSRALTARGMRMHAWRAAPSCLAATGTVQTDLGRDRWLSAALPTVRPSAVTSREMYRDQ